MRNPPFAARAAILILTGPAAWAQQGDRPGEVQHPPPASLVIPPAPILTAAEEMRTFRVEPGFRVELVASDPVIADPVAMQFLPDGRIAVVEMRGFMPDPDGNGERAPVSDVAVLADTGGDGVMDRRSVIAPGLILPRAVAAVGGGFLIAEPPHLWFLRGGSQVEVASDYGNTSNPEHNANGLLWALDNRIYSANATARFEYRGSGVFAREPTITRGQWGLTQDDWGRLYYNSNSDPLRVDLIPSSYLGRNPALSAAGANVQVVPADLPVYPIRVTPGINRGYKTLDARGRMYAVTAACGPAIERGGLFPPGFAGSAFICEPAGNLVKRIVLSEKDGVVQGANAAGGREFLASTDERFRPVNLGNGPDGALYIVDMYRGLIQHRIYLTSYLRQQAQSRGLEKGLHYGRIFRVVPAEAPPAAVRWRRWRRLAGLAPAELAAAVADPNGWVRDTAQRLLVERAPAAAVGPLRALAGDRRARPAARVQALWILNGLRDRGRDALDRPTVLRCLADGEPHVAAAAVRLSERWLKGPHPDEEVERAVLGLTEAEPPSPNLRLQLALTLGESSGAGARAARQHLAQTAGAQPYVADAIVSGLAGGEPDFVRGLAAAGVPAGAAGPAVILAAQSALARGNPEAIAAILDVAADESAPAWARRAVLAGARRFLPRSDDGRYFPGRLPAAPAALIRLAAGGGDGEFRTAAAALLVNLRWPGKVGGEMTGPPLAPAERALFERGRAQFAALCAACHQPAGQGLAGLAPPLTYSKWVLGDPRVLARIVLSGKAQENMTMPPWRNVLGDEQIAAVLTYIRRSWGHEESAVSPALVAAARADTANRTEPWSDADLADLIQDLAASPH